MSTHVDMGTLAALADGTLPAAEAVEVREHLAECRSCMAAYADAVRYRAAWLAHPEAFEPDSEFRRLASAVREAPETRQAKGRRPDLRPGFALVVAAAAVVVGLVVSRTWTPEAQLVLPPAVLEATIRSSARGLILPGAERQADRAFPPMRSGRARIGLELQHEVEQIVDAYERGARGPEETAQVVVALLATGEIDAARDYAREGLRHHPDAVPLLVVAADASYRANDLASAEALLRRAAGRAPRSPLVALDLALVLRQLGRDEEARLLFERTARTHASGLSARANHELSRAR